MATVCPCQCRCFPPIDSDAEWVSSSSLQKRVPACVAVCECFQCMSICVYVCDTGMKQNTKQISAFVSFRWKRF